MDFRNIEKQLRNQEWINDFNVNLAQDLIKQAGRILPRGREVVSLTYANQLKLNGEQGSMWWILVLTDRDIMLLEYPLNSRIDHDARTLKILTFDEIKMVSGKPSKNNQKAAKINIVTDNQAWIFETFDLTSGLHFVEKTERSIINNVNELANVLKTKEFNDLKIIKSQKHPDNLKKHPYFNYFFNYSSLLKSSPALQFIFLTTLVVWLILAITSLALIDHDRLTLGAKMGLGFPMIALSLSSLIFISLDWVNVYPIHKFDRETKHLFMTMIGALYLVIVSIFVSVDMPSTQSFLAISLAFGIFALADWGFSLFVGAQKAKSESDSLVS